MNIIDLNSAINALKRADILAESKAKVQKAPFDHWMQGQSYYQDLSDNRKKEIASEVALWYDAEAVQQRGYEYAQKVFANKQYEETLDDKRDVCKEVCRKFAKIFGYSSFSALPQFQQDILTIMCAIHLKVIPNNCNFNMNKGIFVAGAPQIGKTSAFMYLKAESNFAFRIVTSYALQALAEKHGATAVAEYGTKGKNLVIDEIGWEKKAVHYGTEIDAVADVIHKRNERGLMTHMTSNMSIDDLAERYQPHIIARIQKNCNIIECKGAIQFL